ncbi:MAG: helicase C-terminal domain-containing protein, partial [Coriobacteriales bacterium]|nr:helicase C-terminal domain-containing protein [Coriobacteriales bacterium]
SRDAARFLVRDLRKALPDLATEISFYHAGLERDLRQQLEQAFREASCCCLVCTSAFGEGIDIPGIRHLVVYHPPFSRSALNQLAGRAGRDGRTAFIHLLVEASDFENNRRLLADSLPEREGLAALYRYLNGLSASLPMIDLPDESLAEGAGRLDPEHLLSAQQVAVGLIVFQELELIELEMVGFRRQIRLTPNQHKVELQASSRYLEAYHEMAEFTTFSEWLLTADSSAIEYLIQGPILPGERIND